MKLQSSIRFGDIYGISVSRTQQARKTPPDVITQLKNKAAEQGIAIDDLPMGDSHLIFTDTDVSLVTPVRKEILGLRTEIEAYGKASQDGNKTLSSINLHEYHLTRKISFGDLVPDLELKTRASWGEFFRYKLVQIKLLKPKQLPKEMVEQRETLKQQIAQVEEARQHATNRLETLMKPINERVAAQSFETLKPDVVQFLLEQNKLDVKSGKMI